MIGIGINLKFKGEESFAGKDPVLLSKIKPYYGSKENPIKFI